MRNMKDSGIEWIGKIPEEWNIIRLRFLGETKSGLGNKKPSDFGHGYPFITYKNVYHNVELNTNVVDLVDSTAEERIKFNVKRGDAFFTGSSETIEELGFSSVCMTTIPNATFNGFTIRFRPYNFDNYYPEFMKYSFRSDIARGYINQNDNSITRANLSQKTLKSMNIVIPPLEEQELIADYLDNKVKKIDNIISKTQETIEEYKKYKQSVITEAVTKGLNPNVEMKDSGIEWIGEIPRHWVVRKINSLFNLIGSGTTPKSSDAKLYDGNINWIQSGDINGSILETTSKYVSQEAIDKISTLKIYKNPFIVIAMYGASIGNISLSKIDGCVNQACCVLSYGKYNIKYIFYALKSAKQEFLLQSVGGTQPNISQEIIKSFRICMPASIEEQIQISNYLDKKCLEIDSLITKKQELIIQLESYKKSLIYEYVTGKKEVAVSYGY